MDKNNVFILALIGIAFVALLAFLIWKNQKDKKLLNPDAQDSVEETHGDQQRRSEKN